MTPERKREMERRRRRARQLRDKNARMKGKR